MPGVPGVFSNTANPYVEALRTHPWSALPTLLGKNAERAISNLLLKCGVFQPVESSSNLNQLSGAPLFELKALNQIQIQPQVDPVKVESGPERQPLSRPSAPVRGLSKIRLVRHRMLYAKANLSAKGRVTFGLNYMHVLNRHVEIYNEEQTRHVLKYIFPRQFGLHNVFTSDVDPKDTAQPFKDYTLRDAEIAGSMHVWKQKRSTNGHEHSVEHPPLPKRLRNRGLQLVSRLRRRHARCSYAAMLDHYCPRPRDLDDCTASSIMQASTFAQVSSFCRAAVSKVFPRDFWGNGESGAHNLRAIMRNVDRFVRLRRYESLTLHDVLQGIEVLDISWLALQNDESGSKLSRTDFQKRKELLAELLYYLFDSFLMPLIRGHFHVTESGPHRNQLFYFRHDVWNALSQPALETLKTSMLEEVSTAKVKKGMARRALGVSHVRLLPKEHGMRPIINLRRRVQTLQFGKVVLGKSINKLLTPTFSILNYEKGARPDMLGSAMFSVEDMYPRLQAFRTSLEMNGLFGEPLYFAKVDVKACFDTIPQTRLMKLVQEIFEAEAYRTTKYARGKLIGGHDDETPGFGAKPAWKHLPKATAGDKPFKFAYEMERDSADGRARTVYVDDVAEKPQSRDAIFDLLKEHIESNLIKLGNRFYRQKEGIPQGSIVSSLLCSYFYAELERNTLSFVNDDRSSLMLRLIDDFLVISTKQSIAERFIHEMHRGIPEFGVEVKAEKSRVNFDLDVDGNAVPRLPRDTEFPYCGNAINTVTLDLSKDKERRKKSSEFQIVCLVGRTCAYKLQTFQTQ